MPGNDREISQAFDPVLLCSDLSGERVEILTPTLLEYRAVRRILPRARVWRTGVRLVRWRTCDVPRDALVIVCGLAGALAPDLAAGTVLIPDRVGLIDGSVMDCDAGLVRMLQAGAWAAGFRPENGQLLTAPSLILAHERRTWFQRGFVAADMETGLLAASQLRVATVRVILDHPAREISSLWLHPVRALCSPSLWPELLWLGCAAPRYARRAALVLKAGPGRAPGEVFFSEN